MFLTEGTWAKKLYEDIDDHGADIPCDDINAYHWALKNKLEWVFNKLILMKSQGVFSAPHGVKPKKYPVISKPICNMMGLSDGVELILYPDNECDEDWDPKWYKAGYMWMSPLQGIQYSSDLILEEGKVKWVYTMRAVPEYKKDFWFNRFESETERGIDFLPEKVLKWINDNLSEYTGAFNIEYINGIIIDAHVRHSNQFVDFYGPDWLDALAYLYRHGDWRPNNGMQNKTGSSLIVRYESAYKYFKSLEEPLPFIDGLYGVHKVFEEGCRLDSNKRVLIINGENRFICESIRKEITRNYKNYFDTGY